MIYLQWWKEKSSVINEKVQHYRFDMLNKRYMKLVLFSSIKLLIITMMHEFIKNSSFLDRNLCSLTKRQKKKWFVSKVAKQGWRITC